MVGADSVIHRLPQPGTGDAVMARAEQCDGHVQHVRGGIPTRYWSCRHGLQRFHHGYAWSPELITPEYLPVDEDTSLGFVDPYALSKDLGERIGQMYARLGMSVIALRLHWIMTEQELRQRRGTMDGAGGNRNLWGYVELIDVAHACISAISAEVPAGEFHPLLITAADTLSRQPTATLLEQWCPTVERRREFPGTHEAAGGQRDGRIHDRAADQPDLGRVRRIVRHTPNGLPGIFHRKQVEFTAASLPDFRLTCFFVDRGRRGVAT